MSKWCVHTTLFAFCFLALSLSLLSGCCQYLTDIGNNKTYGTNQNPIVKPVANRPPEVGLWLNYTSGPSPFGSTYTYRCRDPDNNLVSCELRIDNATFARGKNQSDLFPKGYTYPQFYWDARKQIGNHTMEIIATDSEGLSASEVMTFTVLKPLPFTEPGWYNCNENPNTTPCDYMQSYCDKIVPQDLAVRQAAAQAISKHPGAFSINQLLDVYDWVHTNVFYQNVPIDMWPPYPPNETLRTKSGDCKNQAVLIASMVEAIGGSARVLYIPDCRHAFTEVYLGNQTDVDELNSAIWSHYNAPGGQTNWHTHTHDGITENWFIFDTAGGSYPGDTIANCMNASQFFVLMDCNRDPDDLKAPEVRWTGYGPYVGQNDTRVIQAGSGLSYSISNSILQPYSWCRNKIFVESRSARPLDWYLTDETGSQNYLRNKGFYYYYGEEQVQKATYEFDWDKKESFRVIIKNANTKSITAHLEITSTCYKD